MSPYASERVYLTLDDLDRASRAFMTGDKSLQSNNEINLGIRPTTSLGGAKPKVTIRHDGHLWIAKFPERGDAPFVAQNEHVMLDLARELGIEAAESLVHQLPDNRFILLVKRFDRIPVAGGMARVPFASAHTVLGLTGNAGEDAGKKSYLRLSDTSRRWAGRLHAGVNQQIWERMAFNGLVGNIDDHARNHGFLYHPETGFWGLSPAFDIVAFPSTGNVVLSLTLGPRGAIVTPGELVDSARRMGLTEEFAVDRLKTMASHIEGTWRTKMRAAGADDGYIEQLEPAFKQARMVLLSFGVNQETNAPSGTPSATPVRKRPKVF